jgi:hypothetical protein
MLAATVAGEAWLPTAMLTRLALRVDHFGTKSGNVLAERSAHPSILVN